MSIDLKDLGASLAQQFRGLSGRHPGQWPLAPRLLCALGVIVAVASAGYFFYWSSQFEDQERLAQDEVKLREEYKTKIAQAINLDTLKAQRVQVDQYVEQLQKQLPSKAEMAELLSEITHAGSGRGLQIELFKPGQVVVRDYYAELPIEMKVVGTYHDLASFASDMANLRRIVTLNNLALSTSKDGVLMLDAVAKTFRYLDKDEVEAQQKVRADLKKAKGAAK